MDGHAERGPEGGGGHQAHAQPGVRTRAHADHDVADRVELVAGLGQHPVDGGQQQLAVPARVHLAGLGEDAGAVVERDGDGGGGGVKS